MQTISLTIEPLYPVNPSSKPTSNEGFTTPINQQNLITNITLMALPAEVLVYIMGKVDNPLALSMTCWELRTLYQDALVYRPHERQAHTLLYSLAHTINIEALRQRLAYLALEKEKKIVIPTPDSPEWLRLKYDRLYIRTRLDTVKDTYITAWELLLQPGAINDRKQTSELMRLILELIHYVDADQYVAELFGGKFPDAFFDQLAKVHLDRCLRLVTKYFALTKNSPAYAFFLTQTPLITKVKLYKRAYDDYSLTHRLLISPSLLFLVMEDLISQPVMSHQKDILHYHALLQHLFARGCDVEQINDKGETTLVYLLRRGSEMKEMGRVNEEQFCWLVNLLFAEGVNCSAVTPQGNSALTYAIKAFYPPIIKDLLRYCQPDSHLMTQQTVNALYFAIEYDDLFTIRALLSQAILDIDTRVYAFLYTLWCKKGEEADKIITHFFYRLTTEEKSKFVNHAVACTMDNTSFDEFYRLTPLLLQYGADCNTVSKQGMTLLKLACCYQRKDLVKLLLQQPSIEVNSRGSDHSSALSIAICLPDSFVLEALLQHPQIDIDYDFNQESFLSIAIKCHSPKAITLLVQALLAQNERGWPDLETIQRRKRYMITAFLEIRDKETASNKEEMINAFLQPMNIFQKELFIYNAFVAVINQYCDIERRRYTKEREMISYYVAPNHERFYREVLFFLEQGVDCNITDKQGNTALIKACYYC
jgi:hypothetical protein